MMKILTSLTFLSLIILANVAGAADTKEECTYKDKRPQMGEMRSQSNIGWCYANAGADLMGYEYRSELKGQQISAIHLALSFNQTEESDAFAEGGSSFTAMNRYLSIEGRACLKSVEDQLIDNGLNEPLKTKLNAINVLKELYELQRKDKSKLSNFITYWKFLKEKKSLIFSLGDRRLMMLIGTTSKKDLPKRIADNLCANHFQPIQRESILVNATPWMLTLIGEDLISATDKQLSKDNIVGLRYYASYMTSEVGEIRDNSAHMSVIVGRRWKNNQCEYLIRNSWGERCGAYKNPIFKDKCEKGNLWMPESSLREVAYGITFLKNN